MYTSREHIHLEEGQNMLARGSKTFVVSMVSALFTFRCKCNKCALTSVSLKHFTKLQALPYYFPENFSCN